MGKVEKKILFENKQFNVIEKDGSIGVEPLNLSVVIMPFERDERGLPSAIGVLKEYNQMRTGNYSNTLITGDTEGEDPDILATAIRKLKEFSKYDVKDPTKWFYLGAMTGSKIIMQESQCFAVDVTNIKKEELAEDSIQENKNEFMMLSVKDALNTNDSFVPTLFMKVFIYIFGFNISKEEEKPEEKVNKLKKKLDITYLNISGVNGSLVKHDQMGEPYIEYTVKELTDDIINTIPKNVDDINIQVIKAK